MCRFTCQGRRFHAGARGDRQVLKAEGAAAPPRFDIFQQFCGRNMCPEEQANQWTHPGQIQRQALLRHPELLELGRWQLDVRGNSFRVDNLGMDGHGFPNSRHAGKVLSISIM